eukprot:766203-Hanusia_phi.AAC.8
MLYYSCADLQADAFDLLSLRLNISFLKKEMGNTLLAVGNIQSKSSEACTEVITGHTREELPICLCPCLDGGFLMVTSLDIPDGFVQGSYLYHVLRDQHCERLIFLEFQVRCVTVDMFGQLFLGTEYGLLCFPTDQFADRASIWPSLSSVEANENMRIKEITEVLTGGSFSVELHSNGKQHLVQGLSLPFLMCRNVIFRDLFEERVSLHEQSVGGIKRTGDASALIEACDSQTFALFLSYIGAQGFEYEMSAMVQEKKWKEMTTLIRFARRVQQNDMFCSILCHFWKILDEGNAVSVFHDVADIPECRRVSYEHVVRNFRFTNFEYGSFGDPQAFFEDAFDEGIGAWFVEVSDQHIPHSPPSQHVSLPPFSHPILQNNSSFYILGERSRGDGADRLVQQQDGQRRQSNFFLSGIGLSIEDSNIVDICVVPTHCEEGCDVLLCDKAMGTLYKLAAKGECFALDADTELWVEHTKHILPPFDCPVAVAYSDGKIAIADRSGQTLRGVDAETGAIFSFGDESDCFDVILSICAADGGFYVLDRRQEGVHCVRQTHGSRWVYPYIVSDDADLKAACMCRSSSDGCVYLCNRLQGSVLRLSFSRSDSDPMVQTARLDGFAGCDLICELCPGKLCVVGGANQEVLWLIDVASGVKRGLKLKEMFTTRRVLSIAGTGRGSLVYSNGSSVGMKQMVCSINCLVFTSSF